jgi:hypothetical protein
VKRTVLFGPSASTGGFVKVVQNVFNKEYYLLGHNAMLSTESKQTY